jgi:Fic family protein
MKSPRIILHERITQSFGLVSELASRQALSLAQALREFQKIYVSLPKSKLTPDAEQSIEKGFALVDKLEADERHVVLPMTSVARTEGQLVSELLKLDSEHLLNPMRISYIHFFHRLVLMGIVSPVKCGRLRTKSVHVGNPDVYFPVPSVVPKLMNEFCRKFPTILPTVVKYDPIMVAAKVSHRFVSIHPYEDGNGRISRVLMNLVLWGHFPPVYLKANKKGRHRYSQAIRRADRGQFEALGSLIALSLVEIYEKLLDSLTSQGSGR